MQLANKGLEFTTGGALNRSFALSYIISHVHTRYNQCTHATTSALTYMPIDRKQKVVCIWLHGIWSRALTEISRFRQGTRLMAIIISHTSFERNNFFRSPYLGSTSKLGRTNFLTYGILACSMQLTAAFQLVNRRPKVPICVSVGL